MRVADSATVPPLPAWAASVLRDVAASCHAARVPFLHRGRGMTGLDCLGLVLFLHDRIGVRYELPPQTAHYSAHYFRQGGDALYLRGILDLCQITTRPAVGDLVMFLAPGSAVNVGHAGVVTDPARAEFTHAFSSRGVRPARWTLPLWHPRLYGFARPRAFAAVPRNR